MFVCPECGRGYRDGGYCGEDGAVLAVPADPLLGTVVSRWQIARILGAGGMGRVYLGVQPDIGSRVAIKVLAEDCARDPGLVERFFAEARAVNLIRHEHIVGVLDLAKFADGRPYIVMEFVDGVTLGALARQFTLPLGPVCSVVDEILSALGAAHAIGIVHRDLKPDNVLVTPAGHAKVLDFGIAKLAPSLSAAQSPRTRTGALLGTPEYMAPEQIAGKHVDGRTDLYSCGVMLYEIATGRRPFLGENLFDLMRAHVEDEPVAPRQLRPDLTPALEAVILKALAKRADDRFQTANDMAIALADASQTLPANAWAPMPAPPAAGPSQPRLGLSPPRVGGSKTPQVSRATDPVVTRTSSRSRGRAIALVAIGATLVVGGVALGIAMQDDAPAANAAVAPTDAATVETVADIDDVVESDAAMAEEEKVARGGSNDPPTTARRQPPPTTTSPPTTTPPTAPTTTAPQLPKDPDIRTEQTTRSPSGGSITFQRGARWIEKKPDYDPTKIDAIAYIAKAQALARRLLGPDAALVGIDITGVMPDGRVNLNVSSDFEVTYKFRSPAQSKLPADLPRNVDAEVKCLASVDLYSKGVMAYTHDSARCKERILRPKCNLMQVLKKAHAIGAPKDNVAAEVEFDSSGWSVEIGDEFSEIIDDDC